MDFLAFYPTTVKATPATPSGSRTSRPLGVDELGTLRLNDSVGTEYERIDADQVIEGQGSIVFRPALPSGANLHFPSPGGGYVASR